MAKKLNFLNEKVTQMVQVINTRVINARGFKTPQKDRTYYLKGVTMVEIGGEEYPCFLAEDDLGMELNFWPSWLVNRFNTVDGDVKISTIDGKPVREFTEENFPTILRLIDKETFVCYQPVFQDGKRVGKEKTNKTVYHFVTVDE